MKKLLTAVGVATLIAAASAAWTLAAPAGSGGSKAESSAHALPPLPDTVKSRGRWVIGVKCERCWRYVKSVSADPAWAGLCERCQDALAEPIHG